MSAALVSPFEGVPPAAQALFFLAFAVIVLMVGWTLLLFVQARRWANQPETAEAEHERDESSLLWVFLVPALNEEMVIEDSLDRLLAVRCTHRRIVVIDDGSDDRTAELLRGYASREEVEIVTRRAPDARQGKAAALNHAFLHLGPIVDASGFARADTIVGVVDADGRLDADAPEHVAAHFADPRAGGVQVQVRIYNRHGFLGWMQDVEFGIYGRLYQAGRSPWGTAGMGGNGQFNRLSALDDLLEREESPSHEPLGPPGASIASASTPTGPWRDRLTEDQDLGLRLITAGWTSHHDLNTSVDQQGLSNLRRLYRQRTRWSQGNLQAMGLLPRIAGARTLRFLPRFDLTVFGLMPLLQSIVGISLIVAIVLAIADGIPFWDRNDLWQLLFFYALCFGGVIVGCVARGMAWGPAGALRGVLIAQVYAFYTWILWPVLVRSAYRQAASRRSWAKTRREVVS